MFLMNLDDRKLNLTAAITATDCPLPGIQESKNNLSLAISTVIICTDDQQSKSIYI